MWSYKIRAKFPMFEREYRNAIRRYQRAQKSWQAVQRRYRLTPWESDSAACSMLEATGATVLYLWRA